MCFKDTEYLYQWGDTYILKWRELYLEEVSVLKEVNPLIYIQVKERRENAKP